MPRQEGEVMELEPVLRPMEWACLCRSGAIKAWSVRKCYVCGAEKPDTQEIKRAREAAEAALQAVEVYERMSRSVGKGQAMAYVLGTYGGKRD